jgi:N6-L-threonylcarbamoyladenine synthase
VSGGHTSLYVVPEPGVYHLVGRTRDDAAGEAYDKVAKLLGLGYPGGPPLDRMAREGDDQAVTLPRSRFTHPDRNAPPPGLMPIELAAGQQHLAEFSFSGLKTAVVRLLEQRGVFAPHGAEPTEASTVMTRQEIANFCASFQRTVVEKLVDRTFAVAHSLGARSIGISGGVSANSRLRRDAVARGERDGIPVFIPPLSLSTDNAAMIAAAGLRKLARGETSSLDFNAEASLPVS